MYSPADTHLYLFVFIPFTTYDASIKFKPFFLHQILIYCQERIYNILIILIDNTNKQSFLFTIYLSKPPTICTPPVFFANPSIFLFNTIVID